MANGDSSIRQVTVVNEQGLHLRPAHAVAKLAGEFRSNIELIRDGTRVDAKSILAILALAAEPGAQLTIQATGEDSGAALDALARLFAAGFSDNGEAPVPKEPTASGQPQY